MLSKLRDYFNDLDEDKSGAIGQSELEDPLITM
jgi:Ca2+-binding EF-hand superfamily protein